MSTPDLITIRRIPSQPEKLVFTETKALWDHTPDDYPREEIIGHLELFDEEWMLSPNATDKFTTSDLTQIIAEIGKMKTGSGEKISAATPAFDPVAAMRSHRERKTALHRNRNPKP